MLTAMVGFAVVAGGWLHRPPVQTRIDRITGGVLVGFGLKVALTRPA